MTKPLQLDLDRSAKTPLADQIRNGISTAIASGVLASGARLPSWQDLAAQLGVARGTVRSAYEKLSAAQLIVASRSAGIASTSTRVSKVNVTPSALSLPGIASRPLSQNNSRSALERRTSNCQGSLAPSAPGPQLELASVP